MRIDEARQVIEQARRAAGVKRALAAADGPKARRGRPRRSIPTQEIIRAAVLAGGGASISEIASALGGETTKAQAAALVSRFHIPLVKKKSHEAAVLVVLPKDAIAKLSTYAVSRDTDTSLVMAAALQALAGETGILSNLIDDEI